MLPGTWEGLDADLDDEVVDVIGGRRPVLELGREFAEGQPDDRFEPGRAIVRGAAQTAARGPVRLSPKASALSKPEHSEDDLAETRGGAEPS